MRPGARSSVELLRSRLTFRAAPSAFQRGKRVRHGNCDVLLAAEPALLENASRVLKMLAFV